MNKIIVQIQVPINVELNVQGELTEESILNELWCDMKGIGNSYNEWAPTYDDLKCVVRNACFDEDTFDEEVEEGFIYAVS